MRIHQVLAGAAAGDAITNIAINTREVLRRYGESEIYANHIDSTAEHIVRPLRSLAPGEPGDVVILRASIGDADIFAALADRPDRLWIAYHNISPPELFTELDPTFARLLADGRAQVRALSSRCSAASADSTFNAVDLRGLGYDDVTVIPPLLDPFRLQSLVPDPGFALEIERRAPGTVIVFVGQLLPHKRPELLIAAHHLLTAHHQPDATLVLVGTPRFPDYASQLARFATALNLPRV